ncbi:hypothetical protein POTOM_043158 [Populus tomentosa]|uniref:Uncharacterized protein n=1 Tax=Populus tomentosa TaxID=118781 RepID=A0A8X8CH39_POPTO|nr:hypothetical protein POTOM_043158 [Populus tomentosa]
MMDQQTEQREEPKPLLYSPSLLDQGFKNLVLFFATESEMGLTISKLGLLLKSAMRRVADLVVGSAGWKTGGAGVGAQVKINGMCVCKPLERGGSDLSSRYMACVFVRHNPLVPKISANVSDEFFKLLEGDNEMRSISKRWFQIACRSFTNACWDYLENQKHGDIRRVLDAFVQQILMFNKDCQQAFVHILVLCVWMESGWLPGLFPIKIWWKLDTDGSSLGILGKEGAGVLIRREHGDWVVDFSAHSDRIRFRGASKVGLVHSIKDLPEGGSMYKMFCVKRKLICRPIGKVMCSFIEQQWRFGTFPLRADSASNFPLRNNIYTVSLKAEATA